MVTDRRKRRSARARRRRRSTSSSAAAAAGWRARRTARMCSTLWTHEVAGYRHHFLIIISSLLICVCSVGS